MVSVVSTVDRSSGDVNQLARRHMDIISALVASATTESDTLSKVNWRISDSIIYYNFFIHVLMASANYQLEPMV